MLYIVLYTAIIHPLMLIFISVVQEFQMKMETLQQRRDELERKEQQLKESLLKFDKFFKVQQ